MEIISAGKDILFATENGYGKKVHTEDFRVAHRGGVGVRTIPTDKRNGLVIGLALVEEGSNILLIDEAGKIIRLPAAEVRAMGRQAKGVRLIKLDGGQKLATCVSFVESEESQHGAHQEDTGS
jgi:DNA gyrase subunit A